MSAWFFRLPLLLPVGKFRQQYWNLRYVWLIPVISVSHWSSVSLSQLTANKIKCFFEKIERRKYFEGFLTKQSFFMKTFFITDFESKSIWFLCIKSNSILACLKLFFCALFEQVINWSKELIYEFNLNRTSLRLFILFIVYHISGWHFKHFVFCFRFFFNFKIKSSFSLLCKRVLSLYNVHWLISANKF